MNLMSEQLASRRALMLDCARQMIGERGYDGVTVRELAARCRVSVPTLYNQFGGKDALLAAAVEDYFAASIGAAALRCDTAGLPRLLAVIDQGAAQMLGAPDYHRRLLQAFAQPGVAAGVRDRIATTLIELLVGELGVLQRQDEIEPWVEPVPLATQMVSAGIATSIQWAVGLVSDAQLPAAMRYGAALIVLGVARGAVRESLGQIVRQAQPLLPVPHFNAPAAGRASTGA